MTVEELYKAVTSDTPLLTKSEFADLVWGLADRNGARLEDIPPATNSLRGYLRLWERNLSLYVALAASLVAVLVIYVLPPDYPLVMLRWVFGSAFVLIIPGFVTVEALFPKGRELDSIERLALSVGLSLALVPLIGLALNYTPWGIRLDPIVVSLTILTSGLSMVALARRFRLSVERFELENLS